MNNFNGCEYRSNDKRCVRHKHNDIITGKNDNNAWKCLINRPYLKFVDLNSAFTNKISSLRVFKCDSCQPGFYQDQNYRTNCKVCPQGKYTDSTSLTSDCTSCGTGKYQESIAIYSQDFETDAGCSGNNDDCEWECESRTTEKIQINHSKI